MIKYLGSEARTYLEAKVEWTESSDSEDVLERTMAGDQENVQYCWWNRKKSRMKMCEESDTVGRFI